MSGDAAPPRCRGIFGTFFHAPTADGLVVLEQALILVDTTGTITAVIHADDPAQPAAIAALGGDLVRLPEGQFGLPGFVDLHVHAPQYPQLGLALDEPLEIWLQKYTFPLEASYADLDFARPRYESLVDDLLAGGTTTALYFATQDRAATELLADICIAKGQRALVGKVVMDDPAACPDYYRDRSPEAAIGDTRQVIAHIRAQGFFVVDRMPTPEERRDHALVAQVTSEGGYNAERIPVGHPLAREVRAAIGRLRPPVVVPTLGSSLPLHILRDELGVPSVTLAMWNHDNNQHGDDENLRLGNLWDAIDMIGAILTMR